MMFGCHTQKGRKWFVQVQHLQGAHLWFTSALSALSVPQVDPRAGIAPRPEPDRAKQHGEVGACWQAVGDHDVDPPRSNQLLDGGWIRAAVAQIIEADATRGVLSGAPRRWQCGREVRRREEAAVQVLEGVDGALLAGRERERDGAVAERVVEGLPGVDRARHDR